MANPKSPIVISGAGGFLGSAIARLAESLGIEIIAVRTGHHTSTFSLDTLDDPQNLEQLRQRGCATWIHCGWWGVGGADRNDPRQLTVNVPTALKTVLLANEAGCRHWIGIGSQAEFGAQDRPLSEDAPKKPVTRYGEAKVLACGQSRLLCEALGLSWSWLRVFALYGPGDAPNWFIPSLIGRIDRGIPLEMTPGEQIWDYLYVDDAAEAVLRVAEIQLAGDFNLGSGSGVRLKDLAERVRSLMGSLVPLHFGAIPYRNDQVMHLQANIGKLVEKAQWSPRTSLDDGLSRTIAYFRGRA